MGLEGNSSESRMGEEGPSSPKNKVKFLCSQGGKILPRPSDGLLKYVGGETRVVSVPRTITFSELKKKLNSMFEGDMVLKYQLIPDELDALVSVRSDEDMKHMLEEYDRMEAKASSRSGVSPLLRAFLFPANPLHHSSAAATPHTSANDPSAMEQRYIDAINGIVRTPFSGPASARVVSNNANVGGRPIFSISSAGSSPKSIIASEAVSPAETINQDTTVVCDNIGNPPDRPFGAQRSSNMHDMHKILNSPSLVSLAGQHQHQHQQTQFHQQQKQTQFHQQQHHHHHHHHYQQQSRHPHPPVTTQMVAPVDIVARQMGPQSRCYLPTGPQRISGVCSGDGWKGYRTGSGFPDAFASRCSVRQIGAEGCKWNNGLIDYRERS